MNEAVWMAIIAAFVSIFMAWLKAREAATTAANVAVESKSQIAGLERKIDVQIHEWNGQLADFKKATIDKAMAEGRLLGRQEMQAEIDKNTSEQPG